MIQQVFVIEDATPNEAGTTLGSVAAGLLRFNQISIEAVITAGTGGTLDVYLQREVQPNVWADWLHFPQVAAAAVKKYAVPPGSSSADIEEIGTGTASAAGTPALAADTFVGGHPGNKVRAVYTVGAGVSAAGSAVVYITGWDAQ